jgi:hypothetical protein
MMNSEDPSWDKTRSLLREHLKVPPLQHPDFINTRVMETIERAGRASAPAPLFSLRWLAFSGAGILAVALLLSIFVLPSQFPPRGESEFISQVIDARAGLPRVSVTQFRAPDERGVILWLEGTDYIPADAPVR